MSGLSPEKDLYIHISHSALTESQCSLPDTDTPTTTSVISSSFNQLSSSSNPSTSSFSSRSSTTFRAAALVPAKRLRKPKASTPAAYQVSVTSEVLPSATCVLSEFPSTPSPPPHQMPLEASNPCFADRADEVHYYTLCPHFSPPSTRPLDIQPSHNVNTNRSEIAGRCFEWDQSHRRALETIILAPYGTQLAEVSNKMSLLQRYAGTDLQSDYDDMIAAELHEWREKLLAERDEDVRNVWKGFSKRWGPGTVGIRNDVDGGRMEVMWLRPDKYGSK